MGFIIFCIAGPAIGWLVAILISLCSKRDGNYHMTYTPSEPTPTEKKETPKDESSLADKLDTRLTNVFRNPWEGIL